MHPRPLLMLIGALAIAAAARPTARHNGVRLVVAADGNEARYRVREQLAGFDFPNDAVGRTSDVTGALVFDDAGRVVTDESRFSIDARTLVSDQERRDGYLRRRTLVTDSFPTVDLVPTSFPGLPFPLPTAGDLEFQMVGGLTIKGVTRTTTWQVTATAEPGGFRGTATTKFPFDQFQLPKPRVARVLSVADTIQLEYDFRLVHDTASVR